MKLLHHSNLPILQLRNRRQNHQYSLKPRGLWVSVDDSWKDWCTENAEEFLGELTYVVATSEKAHILYINTKEDIETFYNHYRRRGQPWDNLHMAAPIAWDELAKDYDGIIINPWSWGIGFGTIGMTWYMAWDCSSGCIWNKRAIKSITQTS